MRAPARRSPYSWGSLLLAVMVAWMFPVQADAQERPRGLKIAIGGYLAAQSADVATSSWCMVEGSCRELNPFWRPLADRPVAFAAAKSAVALATAWGLWKLAESHPEAAFWVSVGSAVAIGAVAIHNARVASRR